MRGAPLTLTRTPGVPPAPMMMEVIVAGLTVDMEIQMVSCFDLKKFYPSIDN